MRRVRSYLCFLRMLLLCNAASAVKSYLNGDLARGGGWSETTLAIFSMNSGGGPVTEFIGVAVCGVWWH